MLLSESIKRTLLGIYDFTDPAVKTSFYIFLATLPVGTICGCFYDLMDKKKKILEKIKSFFIQLVYYKMK